MGKGRAGSESGRDTPPEQAGAGEGMVEQAREKVQELASKAQETVTTQATTGIERGKRRAADTMSSVAQSLLLSSQQLRDQNEDVSRYVEQAADRIEHLSSYLRTTDVRQVVRQVEDFARRQPVLFLGGAFAVGLLGARFLKSSQQGRSQTEGEFSPARAASRSESYGFERDVTTPPRMGAVADRPQPAVERATGEQRPWGSAGSDPGLSASGTPNL